jgi:hypothetical protein
VFRGKGREVARALENAEERVREVQPALQVNRDRVRKFDVYVCVCVRLRLSMCVCVCYTYNICYIQVSRDRVREFDTQLGDLREKLQRAHTATDLVEGLKQEALSALEVWCVCLCVCVCVCVCVEGQKQNTRLFLPWR